MRGRLAGCAHEPRRVIDQATAGPTGSRGRGAEGAVPREKAELNAKLMALAAEHGFDAADLVGGAKSK